MQGRCKRCRFDPWVRKIPWRKAKQPTPVFLPGASHGQRSLAGYSPWESQRIGHDWATFTPLVLTGSPVTIYIIILLCNVTSFSGSFQDYLFIFGFQHLDRHVPKCGLLCVYSAGDHWVSWIFLKIKFVDWGQYIFKYLLYHIFFLFLDSSHMVW